MPISLTALQGARFQMLFWAILTLHVIRPFVRQAWLESLFPVVFTLVMVAGVWAASREERSVLVAGAFALIAIAGNWLSFGGEGVEVQLFGSITAAAYFAWMTVVFSKSVFGHRGPVSSDIVFGGINVYLLIGLGFAAIHLSLALLSPGAYAGLDAGSDYYDALYFSIVTITTLGYGDVLPLSETARMLAGLEAVLGQLYVAVLLAKLVAANLEGKPSH